MPVLPHFRVPAPLHSYHVALAPSRALARSNSNTQAHAQLYSLAQPWCNAFEQIRCGLLTSTHASEHLFSTFPSSHAPTLLRSRSPELPYCRSCFLSYSPETNNRKRIRKTALIAFIAFTTLKTLEKVTRANKLTALITLITLTPHALLTTFTALTALITVAAFIALTALFWFPPFSCHVKSMQHVCNFCHVATFDALTVLLSLSTLPNLFSRRIFSHVCGMSAFTASAAVAAFAATVQSWLHSLVTVRFIISRPTLIWTVMIPRPLVTLYYVSWRNCRSAICTITVSGSALVPLPSGTIIL